MFIASSTRDDARWAQTQDPIAPDSSGHHGQPLRSAHFQQLGSLPPLAQQYSASGVASAATPTYPSGSGHHRQAYHSVHASNVGQPYHLQGADVRVPRGVNGSNEYALDEVHNYNQSQLAPPSHRTPLNDSGIEDPGPNDDVVGDQRPRKRPRKENSSNPGQRRRGVVPKAAPPRKPTRRGGVPDTPENRAAYAQEQAQANTQPLGPFVSNIDRPSSTRESGVTRARLIDRFPPVIGSYLHYPNKVVLYRGVPVDVDRVREALFHVQEPVLLANSQAIADYWPHCSNIWQRLRRHTATKFSNEGGAQVDIYECRLHERVRESHRVEPTQNLRKRGRKTDQIEDGEGKDCRFRVAVSTYTIHADTTEEHGDGLEAKCKCIPEWLHMSRLPPTNDCYKDYDSHSHSLRLLNKLKNSAGVMFFAKLKVEQGYSYQAVYDWMVKTYSSATQQLEFFTKRDVCNVSRDWREAHPARVLRSEVEESDDDPLAIARPSIEEKCNNAIASASTLSLRAALAEICKSLPQATDIALSVLDYTQPAEHTSDNGVRVGHEVQVPYPGIPLERSKPSKRINDASKENPSLSEMLLTHGVGAVHQSQHAGQGTSSHQASHSKVASAGSQSAVGRDNIDPSLGR